MISVNDLTLAPLNIDLPVVAYLIAVSSQLSNIIRHCDTV